MIRKSVLIGAAAFAIALGGGAAHAMPIAPPAVAAKPGPVLLEEGAKVQPAQWRGRRAARGPRGVRGPRFAQRRAFRGPRVTQRLFAPRRFARQRFHRPVIVERRRDRTGPFIAGLALGAFAGAVLPRVVHPHPVIRHRHVVGTCPPWSEPWFAYCSRFKTFNPHKGTYFPRRGVEAFCHCPW